MVVNVDSKHETSSPEIDKERSCGVHSAEFARFLLGRSLRTFLVHGDGAEEFDIFFILNLPS